MSTTIDYAGASVATGFRAIQEAIELSCRSANLEGEAGIGYQWVVTPDHGKRESRLVGLDTACLGTWKIELVNAAGKVVSQDLYDEMRLPLGVESETQRKAALTVDFWGDGRITVDDHYMLDMFMRGNALWAQPDHLFYAPDQMTTVPDRVKRFIEVAKFAPQAKAFA